MDVVESINALTTIFIERLCEINLKGLKVLKSLKTLIDLILSEDRAISIQDITTIKKSS